MLCALEANLSVTTPRVETTKAVLSSAQTGFPRLLTAGNCPLPQLTEVQARCLSCSVSWAMYCSAYQRWPQAGCPPHRWLQFDTFAFCINKLLNSALRQVLKGLSPPEAAGASQSAVCEKDKNQRKIWKYA